MNGYQRELAEGGRRAAKSLDCPRCGAPVIRGDDDDDVAYLATVDAEPLDGLVGEMLAHFDGRYTCTLERWRYKHAPPGAYILLARDDFRIADPRPPRGTLHRQHRCGPPKPKGTLW